MKFKTFYSLFYKHRFKKASFARKFYLLIILPFKYFYNYFFLEKKKDLNLFAKENTFLFDKSLDYLFEYFNSDKGERYINQYTHPSKKNNIKIQAHGYSKFYQEIFYPIKNEELNIIEVGSFYGNASAALFFYFKNSKIYGADINPDMFRYKADRIESLYVNSSSLSSIKNELINKNIKFDIIIEDASHMLKDQIISLFYLFPVLNKGGYFIIEELDFPETREDMRVNHHAPDLKTILISVLEKKDFNSQYIDENTKKYFLENIEYIKIDRGNMNEIAIIKKK
jgi:ubiquinone/menaquinone biosynthesis C-methylase UbiE